MFAFPKPWTARLFQIALLVLFAMLSTTAIWGQAQSNAADLQGTVKDSTGAVVPNATVTARNPGKNISRTSTSNEEGFYRIVNLPPGDYEITVEAANFKKSVLTRVNLTVGQAAQVDVALEPGQITESVTISDATSDIVETAKTAIATTIDQQRINNLPINERNYLSFALTTSTVGRDNGRPIGPAPTTGLNFGGQRGRSNLVQVDGADNTDNSVNASRSTVSQEAVQEFQVVTNSFAPEFGRSAGGVVNVVTKSGTNDFHGNVFGFLRHRSFQARNAFAPIEDPPFTRTQYGFTIGGPFDRDRTFFFFAFECQLLCMRFYQVIHTIAFIAILVIDHRVTEIIYVAACFPNGWVHKNSSVNTHNVFVHLCHAFPPFVTQVFFQLGTQLAIIIYCTQSII